jgi:hypothetical protein
MDNGDMIRSASAAVVVPVRPVEGGKREGWLLLRGLCLRPWSLLE